MEHQELSVDMMYRNRGAVDGASVDKELQADNEATKYLAKPNNQGVAIQGIGHIKTCQRIELDRCANTNTLPLLKCTGRANAQHFIVTFLSGVRPGSSGCHSA